MSKFASSWGIAIANSGSSSCWMSKFIQFQLSGEVFAIVVGVFGYNLWLWLSQAATKTPVREKEKSSIFRLNVSPIF